jgi:hypothetical protein
MIRKSAKNFSFEFFSGEFAPFKLRFEYNNKLYEITVIPSDLNQKSDIPLSFHLIIDDTLKEINCRFDSWVSNTINDEELVQKIGYYIYKRYDVENI